MGLIRVETKYSMNKIISSPARKAANKINSVLGGQARQALQSAAYLSNPTFCAQCNSMLPQAKKRNKFCDSSCAATFNNTAQPKRKRQKPLTPCGHCGVDCAGKYCSRACSGLSSRKYSTDEERREAGRIIRNETSANYRAKLRNQTPLDEDRSAIREFYAQCPDGYEVDHIVPISKGGPHTLSNLQYLTISDNRRKSNII